MTPNTPLRCRSCSPDIFLCATLQTLTSPLVLILGLDASTLELDHEHRSSPPAVSCPRNSHMGIGLGFDCGMRRSFSTLAIHVLKVPRPAALSRLFPHRCLPFLPRFRRRVGCVFLPSAWSDGHRRGRILSRCYLLPFSMVYQEGSWLQDRGVRTKKIPPRFLDSRLVRLNVGNMMAQGLGGLIAAGVLGGMEGARGIRGWRWVCFLLFPAANVSSYFVAFHH